SIVTSTVATLVPMAVGVTRSTIGAAWAIATRPAVSNTAGTCRARAHARSSVARSCSVRVVRAQAAFNGRVDRVVRAFSDRAVVRVRAVSGPASAPAVSGP